MAVLGQWEKHMESFQGWMKVSVPHVTGRGKLLKIWFHISSQKYIFVWTFLPCCLWLTHVGDLLAMLGLVVGRKTWSPPYLYRVPRTWLCGPGLCLKDYRCTFLILILPDILEKPESFHGNLPFTYLVNLCEKSEGVIGGH